MLAKASETMNEEGLVFVKEDLASPYTEEIAVLQACFVLFNIPQSGAVFALHGWLTRQNNGIKLKIAKFNFSIEELRF